MKEQDKKKDVILQGTLYIEPLVNNLINYIIWKDNVLILFMSTINDGVKKIEKLKKRSSKTSILAKTIRIFFGNYARKLLKTLKFNKLYNHEMGTIDERNKLKRGNTCEMIYRKRSH